MIEINMQMPTKCGLCPCFHAENPMYCQAVKADKNKKIVNPYGLPRPEWCPLKEQEPVPAIQREVMNLLVWCCGSCGVAITDGDKFCRMCGREVKWDEI